MGNQCDLGPFRTQGVYLVVAFDSRLLIRIASRSLLFGGGTLSCIPSFQLLRLLFRKRLWWLFCQSFEAFLLAIEEGLQGIGKVRQQVPAISDLLCFGRSLGRCLSRSRWPISADKFNPRMILEPFSLNDSVMPRADSR